MATHSHEECEKCEAHSAWEERLKLLETIPGILTGMNIARGVFIAFGLVIALIMAIVWNTRAELGTRQDKHETLIASRYEKLEDGVKSISNDAASIKTSVAVLVSSVELRHNETVKEIAEVKLKSIK
jgi:hypothetical protein